MKRIFGLSLQKTRDFVESLLGFLEARLVCFRLLDAVLASVGPFYTGFFKEPAGKTASSR